MIGLLSILLFVETKVIGRIDREGEALPVLSYLDEVLQGLISEEDNAFPTGGCLRFLLGFLDFYLVLELLVSLGGEGFSRVEIERYHRLTCLKQLIFESVLSHQGDHFSLSEGRIEEGAFVDDKLLVFVFDREVIKLEEPA
jgi:hypothetical protein